RNRSWRSRNRQSTLQRGARSRHGDRRRDRSRACRRRGLAGRQGTRAVPGNRRRAPAIPRLAPRDARTRGVERPMMDTATAARAIDGVLRGPNALFTGVSTDSRSLVPGDLFFAVKGDTFDGHDFVSQAFERGAAAAVVALGHAAELAAVVRNAAAATMVCVADPVKALGALARFWRGRFSIPVAGIVGSNGKTTVKEMIAAILRVEFGADNVLATAGNLNNEIGLPLTLLRLRAAHVAAAVEIGMNHP